jgi:hypothetical protein
MSGSWAMRRGQVFVPLQFAITAMGGGMQMTHTSQGNLSMAFGFPNGPVPGQGGVSASGSAPATLRIPRHRFEGPFSVKIPVGGTLIQVTTMLSADGPAAAATLAPGGGPGSFTWCPGDPACFGGGGILSTDPPQGAGAHNGRILYRAGANQFGGVMQMLLAGASSVSLRFKVLPFQAIHVAGTAIGIQHTGGPYSFMQTFLAPPGIVTQPLVPPTSAGLITAPGPVVRTIPADCGSDPTPVGEPCTLTQTGFPFTTGTVFAQQTTGTGGDDFFTAMGSDLRTALGAGNIALVAGGLSRRERVFGEASYASFGRVQLTLAPPTPSLSPAGLATAALLLLLAAGYAARRRHR